MSLRTDLAGYCRLHLRARLPFRLLRELVCFACRSRQDLHAGVQATILRLPAWKRWLPPEATLRVDASGSAPGLAHSHYSALEVKNALVDLQRQHFGSRSSVDLDAPDRSFQLPLDGGVIARSRSAFDRARLTEQQRQELLQQLGVCCGPSSAPAALMAPLMEVLPPMALPGALGLWHGVLMRAVGRET